MANRIVQTQTTGQEACPQSLPTRRGFLTRTAAMSLAGLALAKTKPARAAIVRTDFSSLLPYGNGTLPAGIRTRHIANVNGMTVHILEAGYETPNRPAILLLHGFPELAESWRKVMPPSDWSTPLAIGR